MRDVLGNLASVRTGYTFRQISDFSINGDLCVIQMKDLQCNIVASGDEMKRVQSGKIKERHYVGPGDIVFKSRGITPMPALIEQALGTAVVAAPLLVIKNIKRTIVLPEYLTWYMSQTTARAYFYRKMEGSAQQMINKQALEQLEVNCPSLEIQKEIVELASLSIRESAILELLSDKRRQIMENKLMRLVKKGV